MVESELVSGVGVDAELVRGKGVDVVVGGIGVEDV